MNTSIRPFARPRRAVDALILAVCVLLARTAPAGPAGAATLLAPSAPAAPAGSSSALGVTLSPSSATAGSANTLTFAFTATDPGSGTAWITVPSSASKAPWSTPQVSSSALPGYVTVQDGTCNSAGPATAFGSTIAVKFKCAPGKTFRVVYGAGAAKTSAAQLAGPYTFTTQVNSGAGYKPVPVQPLVTVNPGPAASLALTGLSGQVAGASQAGNVTALDAYGNVASSYAGTLQFTTNDTKATPPPNTTAVAGQASFNMAFKTAGMETITATDTVKATVTGAATVNIVAGPFTTLAVGFGPTIAGYPAPALPAFPGDGGLNTSCGAQPQDDYGNHANFHGDVLWSTSNDPYSYLPGCNPKVGCGHLEPVDQIVFGCMFGTQGLQTVTVRDPITGVSGQTMIYVIGPVAHPDTLAIVDPTHMGTSLYTLDPMKNDDQTSGLTGNVLLGVFTNTISAVTQQPGYTDDNGDRQRVGVMKVSADGTSLVWEMDPSLAVLPPPEGYTVQHCPTAPTDDVCHVAAPITAQYTITDGVNVSAPATITFNMDTPDTPQVVPTVPTAVYTGGWPTSSGSSKVTVSTPGGGSVQVPALEQGNVSLTPTGQPDTYSISISFASAVFNSPCPAGGCPDTVTLSGTASIPDSLVASSSGSNLSAALHPCIEYNPLSGIYEGCPGGTPINPDGTLTGFAPVTIYNNNLPAPNTTYVPSGYAGIFGFMTISCQSATVDVNCPAPTVSFTAPASAVLEQVGGVIIGAPPESASPYGCAASPPPYAVGQPVPIGVELENGTANMGGTIEVTIWGSGDGGSCGDGTYWLNNGNVMQVSQMSVSHGNGVYTTSWTPGLAGHYIIGAVYHGDFSNTAKATFYYVFDVE